MLDIKFIRENKDLVIKDLKRRHEEEKSRWVNELLTHDEEYRKLKKEVEELRHKRNVITGEVNSLIKQGKDAKDLIADAKEIPEKIKKSEESMAAHQDKVQFYLMRIPNMLHESVPYGKDSTENVEIRKWGIIKQFDFELKPHGELAEALGIAEFKKAAVVSGTGFNYLKGGLAMLDFALQRFAVDFLVKKGFTVIEPPMLLGREAYEGVTDLADFEKVMYKIDGENLYLIATSEHPLIALHKDETFEEKELPIKYCGISSCFRREIGSHGIDTRGFFRMHQFNKIEQVVFCKPEDSWKIHEEILKNTEEMWQALEIPFRVVNICTGDIGIVAAKKYDIEAWFPRQGKYGEVASCSNCTSYQAVRSNIKYRKEDGEKEYPHTLNNTGIATSRAMVAIIENYQNKDGSITVPKVLVPYMNGMKKIETMK